MNNATDTNELSCCECCKAIPVDAAFTAEGVDYVAHFCGLSCYQRFVARSANVGENPGSDADRLKAAGPE